MENNFEKQENARDDHGKFMQAAKELEKCIQERNKENTIHQVSDSVYYKMICELGPELDEIARELEAERDVCY